MGFSTNDAIVEANLFKGIDEEWTPVHGTLSAKWYETIALDMSQEYNLMTPFDAVQEAWQRAGRKLHPGWSLVVIEPYHRSPYPVLIRGV